MKPNKQYTNPLDPNSTLNREPIYQNGTAFIKGTEPKIKPCGCIEGVMECNECAKLPVEGVSKKKRSTGKQDWREESDYNLADKHGLNLTQRCLVRIMRILSKRK